MLKGIDISNHQGRANFNVPDGIDFCIVKATEGINFVDPYCDGYVTQCEKKKILWGFFHFNRNNNPEDEAQFFYDNCKGYINKGIPVLDYEIPNADDVNWCERFLKKFHSLSGVWPIIYMSQIYPIGIDKFRDSWIPKKCGLWCANYDRDYRDWPTECFINPYPWDCVAIWQFASDFNVDGFAIDADIAYMSKEAWKKYAGVKEDDSTDNKSNNSGYNNDTNNKILTGRFTLELD